MAKHSHLPKYNELLNPLFQALHDQIAVNSGPDRFSTIFIHYARFDTQRLSCYMTDRAAFGT
jgi:hypothetical protein